MGRVILAGLLAFASAMGAYPAKATDLKEMATAFNLILEGSRPCGLSPEDTDLMMRGQVLARMVSEKVDPVLIKVAIAHARENPEPFNFPPSELLDHFCGLLHEMRDKSAEMVKPFEELSGESQRTFDYILGN